MNYSYYRVGFYSFDIGLILKEIKKQIDLMLDRIEKTEQKIS